MRYALAVLLICSVTLVNAKLDQRCHSACMTQGFVPDFCTRVCTYDPEKGTTPVFGGAVGPEPAPAPAPEEQKRPPELKPRPPVAVLVPVYPREEELRGEVRNLKNENAALKRELGALRRTLEELQGRSR